MIDLGTSSYTHFSEVISYVLIHSLFQLALHFITAIFLHFHLREL